MYAFKCIHLISCWFFMILPSRSATKLLMRPEELKIQGVRTPHNSNSHQLRHTAFGCAVAIHLLKRTVVFQNDNVLMCFDNIPHHAQTLEPVSGAKLVAPAESCWVMVHHDAGVPTGNNAHLHLWNGRSCSFSLSHNAHDPEKVEEHANILLVGNNASQNDENLKRKRWHQSAEWIQLVSEGSMFCRMLIASINLRLSLVLPEPSLGHMWGWGSQSAARVSGTH